MSTNSSQRVLILGGGFAGVYTALHLEQELDPTDNVEVTLVSRENFFLYTPMLTEVAASAIETTHAVNPIRNLFKRTRFVEGNAIGIDTKNRSVSVRLLDGREQEFGYDHLVVALGSVTAYHGMKDVEEYAFPIKTLGDALQLRNWVIEALETAAVEDDPTTRRELLTFVIAGGGFTGVELTGSLNVFVHDALRVYPTISPGDVRIVLVEGAERLLPQFDEDLASFAQTSLESRGVEVRLGAFVSGATPHEVQIKDGAPIPTRTLVWASGVTPAPLVASSDLPTTGRGWVTVNADMSVPGFPGVWALGDCAQIPNPLEPGKFQPALAQHAIREAQQLARNIVASMRGQPAQPFLYKSMGQLAMLGYHDGIAMVGRFKARGYLAWALWRAYYLWRLPRTVKKARVTLDWIFEDLFGRDITELRTDTRRTLAERGEEARPAEARQRF